MPEPLTVRELLSKRGLFELADACDEQFAHLPVIEAAEKTIGRLREDYARALRQLEAATTQNRRNTGTS